MGKLEIDQSIPLYLYTLENKYLEAEASELAMIMIAVIQTHLV